MIEETLADVERSQKADKRGVGGGGLGGEVVPDAEECAALAEAAEALPKGSGTIPDSEPVVAPRPPGEAVPPLAEAGATGAPQA